MRKPILLLLLFVLVNVPLAVMAQNGFTVSGTITSAADGQPLIGVSIVEKGTVNGIVTDLDGNYTLKVTNAPATLVYSYIGMRSVEQEFTKAATFDLVMEDDSEVIGDVVVVAYGTRKKGTIAGSVASVKSDKLEAVPAAGFDQALQGQTAGLTVVSSSGEPSEAASFVIRGTNSINSGSSPLFILDGVPISSSDFNTLSPNDIESVSVLKDASSTSIYGARAANGVVVITTKRGKMADHATIAFRGQRGFSSMARNNWYLMNTAERIAYEKELGLDEGQNYEKLSQVDVNWLETVFRKNTPLQSYDISVNGANERVNYYVSGTFFDQDGISQGSTFRRFTLRTNIEARAKEWLKLGTNTMGTYEEIERAEQGAYYLNTPISASRFMLPYWDPYNADGSVASGSKVGEWAGTGENPLEWMDNNPSKHKKYKVLSTIFAELSPFEGFKFRSQFGVDYTHTASANQSLASYWTNMGEGMAGRSSQDAFNLTVTNTATYNFDIDRDHMFNVLLGQEGVDYQTEGFDVTSQGQKSDVLANLGDGTRVTSWGDNTSSYAFLSFFGRAEYNYKTRFYADFSVRSDASSRFGRDNRWATFWSVGFMWNLHDESFMEQFHGWLTGAQFKVTTGTSGNSSIPNYDHLALVGSGMNYMGNGGIYAAQRGNEKLSWEKLWTTNVALSLGFWNRLNVDIELYNKLTSDMLMDVPESFSNGGYGSNWDNVGAMVNRGVELAVNADVLTIKDFTWNVNANVSFNHNEITELYNGIDEFVNGNTGQKFQVGHDAREFYLNRYAGVDPTNGDALWYDKDGNITREFNEADKVMTGKSCVAPWQGGFATAFAWKGIRLSAQFSWMADKWVMNNDRYFEESNGLYTSYNQSRRLLYDRWKNPGDVTDIPRHGISPQFDTRFLENASFMRLKNVMLSYNLPQELLAKTNFFASARVYVQGQNLYTWTNFMGLDPETNANVYKAQYPATRQISFGLDFTF